MSAETVITWSQDSVSVELLLRESGLSPAALPLTVQEEGTLVASRRIVNLIGTGVTAVDNPAQNRVDITIDTTGSETSDDVSNESGVAGATVTDALDQLAAADTLATQRTYFKNYIKAPNTGAGDFFGIAIAVSGNWMVIGARADDSNASGVYDAAGAAAAGADNSMSSAGSAYVYTRANPRSPWELHSYLKASNPGVNDLFGHTVAISTKRVVTIVVGAVGESSNATGINGNQADNSASQAGAVYVFVLDPQTDTFSQQCYMKPNVVHAGDYVGFSLALDGDTLVVGAPLEDSNATTINGDATNTSASGAGCAIVFERTDTTWAQTTYVKPPNTEALDEFGYSVAIDGDLMLVSAYREDSAATGIDGNQADNSALQSGAVYAYRRSGASWVFRSYIKAPNTGAGDGFGVQIGLSRNTLVVGAWFEGSSATGIGGDQSNNDAALSGAAYVYELEDDAWSFSTYLKAPNTGASDLYGISVAISGDVIVVGAAGEDSNATGVDGDQSDNSAASAGAGYVYRRAQRVWGLASYIKAPNAGAGDEFAFFSRVDGNTIVVGAAKEDSNATGIDGDQSNNSAADSGAVHTYEIEEYARSNDPKLFDPRTPTHHAESHESGGTDPLTLATSQITGLDAALSDLEAAITSAVAAAVADLVASAPGTLDTLGELSDALGDDPNFATTVTNLIAAKISASLYDAHTILAATTDDTPAALTVGEQTLVGRITGGNIAALTPAQIRTLLTLVIGTDVQAYDAELAAIAGLTSAADKVPYFTGSGTAALGDFTAAGRAMAGAASAAAQTALLGASTESLPGIIELATQTEVNAGTDATRAVTPLTLATHIGSVNGRSLAIARGQIYY